MIVPMGVDGFKLKGKRIEKIVLICYNCTKNRIERDCNAREDFYLEGIWGNT